MYGQYRVLTPTMYRSRMVATRQAVAMDCENHPCIVGAGGGGGMHVRGFSGGGHPRSPLLQILRAGPGGSKLPPKNQDSLELELGASATRVWPSGGKREDEQHHRGGGSRLGNSNNTGETMPKKS